MKKNYLVLLLTISLSIFSFNSFGQAANYIFSQTMGTYTPLSSPTTIFSTTWDDSYTTGVPIGFTFKYLGTNYTTVGVNCNGYISFNTPSFSYSCISSGTLGIAALSNDLYGSSTAGANPITYQTIGTSPNRIFVVQWSNCSHYSAATTGPLNFQIQLYETTNEIHIVYGNFAPTSSSIYSPQVGIKGATSTDFNNRTTTTDWTMTTAGSSSSATCRQSNTIKPPTGLTFIWTPVCQGATAGSIAATATSGCSGYTTVLSASGYSTDLGNSIQWQSSPNGTTWSNISGATDSVYTATVTTSIFYRNNVLCSYTGTGTGTSAILARNNTPEPIGGTMAACIGGSAVLTDASTGGIWASSNAGIAAIDSIGHISGVTAGAATITYTTAGCFATTTVTINPLPAVFSVAGGGSYCDGGAGVHVSLSSSVAGVRYQLFNGYTPYNTALGTGSSVDFGLQTDSGTYTVVATDTTTGCSSNMTGSATVTINPVPGTITGLTGICAGNSTTLSNSVSGGTWSSSFSPVASINMTTGVLTAIAAGTTTITYRLPAGCYTTMLESTNPAVPPIFGTTDVCPGLTTSLTNSTYGGTWTTSNPALATIDATGIVTGVTAGTDTIVYTVSPGCATFVPLNVNPLPTVYSVTGGGQYCAGEPGVSVGLSNSDAFVNYDLYNGGTYVTTLSGSSAALDYGMMTSVGSYTVFATNTLTSCVNNMAGSATVIMNPLPDVYNVLGGGDYCAGGAGVHVTQDFSTPGISYQLYVDGVPTGSPIMGTSSGLDFGLQTTGGSYTVLATNATTSCTNNMSGAATVNINLLPTAYNVTGGGNYCSGGTGLDVSIDGSDGSINYQLYKSGIAVGTPHSGIGSSLSFGNQTAAGTYTVMASDAVTGCTNNMTGSAAVVINPLPAVYTMSGGGNTCAGSAGVNVILNNSDLGVNYQLMNGSTAVGSATAGSGTSLDFGPQTAGGMYTVVATDSLTCTSTTGSATVIVNPIPDAYAITGGGDYCAGGNGVHIGLGFSAPGISYRLMRGTTPVGAAVNGTGAGIDFGLQTTAGTYSVHATNPATTCNTDMTGTVNVNINSLPSAFTTTGGGAYCNGGAGMHIGLASSTTGVDYQLYRGSTTIGAPVNGTGGTIDFGLQTASGSYTIIAADAITGCTKNMTGAAIITINSLPTAYTVTGGGNYCAGGGGQHVGLSSTTVGIHYQLYKDMLPVGTVINGTGGVLDFGLQTAPGNYTVGGVNNSTACANNMTGAATIAVDALPAVYAITGGGNYCAGTAGVHVNLTGSSTGINYELYKDGTATGIIAAGSTGSALDFGLQTLPGSYTAVASNGITGCTSNMTGATSIGTISVPAAYTVTGGGTICSGGTGAHVGLSGSATGVNYQLYRSGSPVGTTVAGTGAMLDFGVQTAAGSYMVIGTSGTSTCSSNMVSSANITVNPAPVAFALTGGGNYCSGGSGVHIGLSGSNFGNNYQLFNGTSAVGSPWGGTGAAIDFGLQTDAGTYHVEAVNTTTSCTNNMSGSANVVVDPSVTPGVLIATSTGDNKTCAGVMTTFDATAVNGGATPTYQWTVNGSFVGGGSSYSYIPAHGDVVKTVMTTSAACATTPTANSTLTMTVITYQLPSATIVSDKGNEVCSGTPVTFTATPVNEGSGPTYIWLKNSAMAGTGTSYTYTPADGDVVMFMMTSNMRCRLQDSAYSNAIAMTVGAPLAPTVTLTNHIGANIGVGQWDTLKAHVTNGGTMPAYQWVVNGTEIPGANSSVYYTNTLFDGDSVTCIVTTTGNCGGQKAAAGTRIHLRNVGVTQVASAGSDIRVMPNPNNGSFSIKGSIETGTNEEVTVEVTNMLGQVVYTNKVMPQNGSINLQVKPDNVANGMYLLSMQIGTNKIVRHIAVEK